MPALLPILLIDKLSALERGARVSREDAGVGETGGSEEGVGTGHVSLSLISTANTAFLPSYTTAH